MAGFERTEVQLVSGWMAIGAMQGKTEPFDEFRVNPTISPSPCRDYFQIFASEGRPTLLFAVADGVSSRPHSDEGARVAAEAAIKTMRMLENEELLSEGGLRKAMSSAHQMLAEEATATRQNLDDLATTLIVGVVDRVSGQLACMAIGDGYVLARSANGPVRDWWFPSKLQAHPLGLVYSLTDVKWGKATHFEVCPFPVATAIAVTDGLKRLAVEHVPQPDGTSTPHASARGISLVVKAVVEGDNVSRTRDLSNLLGFRSSTSLMSDDRTIVVLQRLVGVNEGAAHVLSPSPGPPLASSTVQFSEPGQPKPLSLQRLTPEQTDSPVASEPEIGPSGPRLMILVAVVAVLIVVLAGSAALTTKSSLDHLFGRAPARIDQSPRTPPLPAQPFVTTPEPLPAMAVAPSATASRTPAARPRNSFHQSIPTATTPPPLSRQAPKTGPQSVAGPGPSKSTAVPPSPAETPVTAVPADGRSVGIATAPTPNGRPAPVTGAQPAAGPGPTKPTPALAPQPPAAVAPPPHAEPPEAAVPAQKNTTSPALTPSGVAPH